MSDRELLLERLERLAIVLEELMPGCAELVRDAIALLKDDETRIQYFNDHIAMCKVEVERIYKEQENASKRNPVIVCPHCGKRVK